MKRTTWALFAMLISFLLGTIIALGSLISVSGRLDTGQLIASPLNVPTLLVTFLDPAAILLEIVAIILLVIDSKKLSGPQHRLTRAAALGFIIWAILNLGVFLPLTLASVRLGSFRLLKLGQMVKAGAALIQYTIPFLLVFTLTRNKIRLFLVLALVLSIISNFGVLMMSIEKVSLEVNSVQGQASYVPHFKIDYRQGLYPIFLGLGYLGGGLYMLVYGILAVQYFRLIRRISA